MTETPTERAARALYIHECVNNRGQTPDTAQIVWDDPQNRTWRDLRIASMAAAIAEYEAAKAEESAAKRERAVKEAKASFAAYCEARPGSWCRCAHEAGHDAITAYERVMAEPRANGGES
jgi:hypothetical protein